MEAGGRTAGEPGAAGAASSGAAASEQVERLREALRRYSEDTAESATSAELKSALFRRPPADPAPKRSEHTSTRTVAGLAAVRSRGDGDEVDRQLDPAQQESLARSIVLRKLTASPRSRLQLHEALQRREIDEEIIERVLDRFTDVGLVDDAAFAEAWVRSRERRGLGRGAVVRELRAKGIDAEGIADALGEYDPDVEEARAYELASRRARQMAGLPMETRVRRLSGMLARKGYRGDSISRVVWEAARLVTDEGEDGPVLRDDSDDGLAERDDE